MWSYTTMGVTNVNFRGFIDLHQKGSNQLATDVKSNIETNPWSGLFLQSVNTAVTTSVPAPTAAQLQAPPPPSPLTEYEIQLSLYIFYSRETIREPVSGTLPYDWGPPLIGYGITAAIANELLGNAWNMAKEVVPIVHQFVHRAFAETQPSWAGVCPRSGNHTKDELINGLSTGMHALFETDPPLQVTQSPNGRDQGVSAV